MNLMSLRLLVISGAVSLVACSGSGASVDAGSLFLDLGPRKTSVSGVAYDPEAFFFAAATWPPLEDGGQDPNSPPPSLFSGIPHLTRSAIAGAAVSARNGVSGESSVVSSADNQGIYHLENLASTPTEPIFLQAQPQDGGVAFNADFPSPPFVAIPVGKYGKSTTLRPIFTNAPNCALQMALMAGDQGALDAVARYRTSKGMPTTVADLLDPAKSSGVALLWAHPAFFFEYFLVPGDSSSAAATVGTVYNLSWSPPDPMAVNQSPMGYSVTEDATSPIGYFAIVLPPGGDGTTKVTLSDTVSDPMQARPFQYPPQELKLLSGEVSIGRVFGFPSFPESPPDPTFEGSRPSPDFSYFCYPR